MSLRLAIGSVVTRCQQIGVHPRGQLRSTAVTTFTLRLGGGRGINVGTFRQGYYAARKRTPKGGPVRFVPVRVGPAEARRPGLVFEARLNEVSMRFEVGTDVHYVASLLRRLSAGC